MEELKGWWYNVKRFQMQQTFTLQNTDIVLGAQIRDEIIAREENDQIIISEIESIVVTVGNTNKISVQSFPPINPKVNDLWVDTSDHNKMKFWDGDSWEYKQDGILFAAISEESTVRAGADEAFAQQITTIITNYEAADASLTSAISVESTTRSNADATMASQITTIDSQYKAADIVLQSAITFEASTRSTADTALANSISTIQAGIGNKISVGNSAPTSPKLNDLWLDTSDVTYPNKYKYWDGTSWQLKPDGTLVASVTTEINTRAQADTNLSSKYTLTVAAGDVVTGMNITSASGPGVNISSVTFVAANFKIHNGVTGITMFNISGSQVLIANTLVVSTANKVFIGAGNFNNPDTSFYVDAFGYLSLKNLLVFDPVTPALTIAGTIYATAGYFGNSSSDVAITSDGLVIGNTGRIITNGVTGVMSGVGIWLGFDGGYHKFRVGDPNGAYILWDGLNWHEVNFSDHMAVLGSQGGGGSISGNFYQNISPSLQVTVVVTDSNPHVISFSGGYVANATGSTGTVKARIIRGGATPVELGQGQGIVLAAGQSVPVEMSGTDTPGPGTHTYVFQLMNTNNGSAAGGGTLIVT